MRIGLPVETIVRELKGKVWLALNLVDEGHEVVLGELSSMKEGLDVVQPDVFFRTSAVYSEAKLRQNQFLRDNDARIVVLDTEGDAFRTPEEYRERRLHTQMLETVDRFFAWGSRSADIVESTEGFPPNRTVVTGNPRFDILREGLRDIYRTESNQITDEFGEFVLVNTNFTRVNPHGGDGDVPRDSQAGELFHAFVDLCFELNTTLPNHAVVLRPHPGENHDAYESAFSSAEDIHVEHFGDVRSWIYGATAVVHNKCTTGIEAALMERPVFAYTPVEDQSDPIHPSNRFSRSFADLEELCSEIKSLSEQSRQRYPLDGPQRTELKQYIHNVDCSATDAIVEQVNELEAEWSDACSMKPPLGDRVKRVGTKTIGIDRVERILEQVPSKSYDKLRQKFPELTRRQLAAEIAIFSPFIETDDIQIEQLPELGYVYSVSKQ